MASRKRMPVARAKRAIAAARGCCSRSASTMRSLVRGLGLPVARCGRWCAAFRLPCSDLAVSHADRREAQPGYG